MDSNQQELTNSLLTENDAQQLQLASLNNYGSSIQHNQQFETIVTRKTTKSLSNQLESMLVKMILDVDTSDTSCFNSFV